MTSTNPVLDATLARYEAVRTRANELRALAGDDSAEFTDDHVREAAALGDEAEQLHRSIEHLRTTDEREVRSAQVRPAGSGGDGEMLLRAITEASGIGAAATPPEYASSFWDRLVAQSVILQAGAQVVTTSRDSLVIPRITADPTATWTAEAATITASDPGADTLTATPRKLASLVRSSNEALADSSPSIGEMLNRQLARSLSLGMDLGAFEGSGTAPAIRGLRNVSGIQTASMGTNGALLTNLDPIATALGAIAAANGTANAIFMHPAVWASISKIKEATGSAVPLTNGAMGNVAQAVRPSLLGVPVYATSQLSVTDTQGSSSLASRIYVADMSQVLVVKRAEVAIEVDRSVYFASDETAIRAITRVDMVVPNPLAVYAITGVLSA